MLDIKISLCHLQGMKTLLRQLGAAAEPTRLRLLALAAENELCVAELTQILRQSQPRLSRHLKLLADADLLERTRDGSHVFFHVPDTPAGRLARMLLARIPDDDPTRLADRRQAARVVAERARLASESFRRDKADWDELRALRLPAAAIEAALLAALPERLGRVLDIGTGTGRMLEVLAPRAEALAGVDASRAMLALARDRIARRKLRASVRLGDMYRLPFQARTFDTVTMQMVLHYADDPAAALAEAARMVAPGGTLAVVDLAPHEQAAMMRARAHVHPGFGDDSLAGWSAAAGLQPHPAVPVQGPLEVRVWCAARAPVTEIVR